jgi:nucleoside-diphosphate-sugar epimerase
MMTVEERLAARVLIVGCGDIGRRVAQRLRAMGREVTAITRSPPSAAQAADAGLRWIAADLDRPLARASAPLLFWFAPPPASGAGDPRLRAWLATQGELPARLVYISTSGVYGDCQGRWIDEDEPLRALSERARRRLDAESALLEAAQRGTEVVILRVPGIYGPGRLPRQRLQQRQPVLRAQESPYTNRIHADDLALAALHAAAYGRGGRAYNVSDGQPTTMCDYFLRCARLLGLPEPPQISLEEARRQFTPAMWSFMEQSKRLRTERLRQELHFMPRYPGLELGLPACLAAEGGG